MQYNSISFLFLFFPIFLAAYYVLPAKLRNISLLIGSLVFYYISVQSHPWMLAILLGLTLLSYSAGLLMCRKNQRWIFFAITALLVAVLVFFKLYLGGTLLPVGLSFYLFQILAYLVAVYQGKQAPERNVLRYGTGIAMFPKLLSGPLMDPDSLSGQVKDRKCRIYDFHRGLQELILGLAMKVLLANRLGGLWGQAAVVGYDSISPGFAWLALIAFAMRLYFDFHGYSLMAMGIGRMLGFEIPRNFDDPYASRSVSEFYRRWHVTLGLWFRNCIYIPLGGNRKGTGRTMLNLLIVWALTGFWHGVGGNYLLWAGILLLFILLERLFLHKLLERTYVFAHLYTVFVILISWVPFAIGDFGKMTTFLGRLFGLAGQTINPTDFVGQAAGYKWLLLAGVVLATPWPRRIWEKIRHHWIVDIFMFALLWIAVFFVATAAQDPFMYFQY